MTEPRPNGPPGPACPTCGMASVGVHVPPAELEDPTGAVMARLAGVVAWRCDDGHVSIVDGQLVTRVAAAMERQLVVARRRRLRRDDACGSCGQPLTMPGRRTETPVVDDTGPSVVTLSPTTTMVRCPACDTEQVPSDAAAILRALLVDLVATAAAPPR